MPFRQTCYYNRSSVSGSFLRKLFKAISDCWTPLLTPHVRSFDLWHFACLPQGGLVGLVDYPDDDEEEEEEEDGESKEDALPPTKKSKLSS